MIFFVSLAFLLVCASPPQKYPQIMATVLEGVHHAFTDVTRAARSSVRFTSVPSETPPCTACHCTARARRA